MIFEVISLLEELMTNGKIIAKEEDQERLDTSGAEKSLNDIDQDVLKQAATQGYNGYYITIVLKENTLLKSVRVYTIFQALESAGIIIKAIPSVEDLEEEKFDREFSLVYVSTETRSIVEEVIERVSEIESFKVEAIPLDPSETVRPEFEEAEQEAAATSLRSPNDVLQASRTQFVDKFVRVETERLDALINLVGELVISRTQVLEMAKYLDGNEQQRNALTQLDKVTTDLQYASMKLRMVPIRQVFSRFPRMVRDLAQECGKKINLVLSGEDTELDRSLVNQIGDPLVHLIRNSVDHGIETPEARIRAGKDEQGTINVGARHEGGYVIIEVSDDGNGIDVERVKKRAIEKGLLPADSQELSIPEAVELLFTPGFSTAEKVSDISGRGVGMDAVKTVVESLSGSIEMFSEPGKGSTIQIRLPLTLAIIKTLLVECQEDVYAIPIQSIRENLHVSLEDIKTVQRKQVIVVREEIIPLFDLAECLGFGQTEMKNDLLSVIIVDVRGEKVGFLVDQLIGQQEIVIKSLSEILGDVPGIAGAAVLGDGRVALILDTGTIIKQGV